MKVSYLRYALLAVAFAIVSTNPAEAQTRSLLGLYNQGSGSQTRFITEQDILSSGRSRDEQIRELAMNVPLEGAIESDGYQVGPNDVFTIVFGGSDPTMTTSRITPEGFMMLPYGGRVDAAGKTLGEVTGEAHDVLKPYFASIPIEIRLTIPRQFYVHVAGAVPKPGRHLAVPVARVDDILQQAFFNVEKEPTVTNIEYRPALRNIQLISTNGEVRKVDLVHYYRTGSTARNHFLRDGDAVHVPPYRPARDAIFIDGDIPFPAAYDHRDGDTVLDILQIGAGALDVSHIDSVVIIRREGSGISRKGFRVAQLLDGTVETPPVKRLDHISVPMPQIKLGSANIEGEVNYPGSYPILAGKTTLSELLEFAGGVREDALLSGAYLRRLTAEQRVDRKKIISQREREVRDRLNQRFELVSDTSSILKQMRLGDLDFLSMRYLARQLVTENRVAINLTDVLKGSGEEITLQDGDALVVPRDEKSVRVVGEVLRPGAVMYDPAKSFSRYISEAGGRSPNAKEVYVLKAGTGQILDAAESDIGSGDVLFVDRKVDDPITVDMERLAMQKRDDRRRNTQFYFGLVTGTLSIALSSFTLIELLRQSR